MDGSRLKPMDPGKKARAWQSFGKSHAILLNFPTKR